MSQDDNSHRLDLGAIIAALHDSEINGEVSWFYDGAWRVKLGDEANGFVAEAVVTSPQQAAQWLHANALRRYPASEFAKRFPRSANDL
jgi:hypothetical protein